MDAHAAVQLVLEVLAQRAEASDRELVEALRVNGADAALAARAVLFVPLAFGRAMLRGAGVRFPGEFELVGADQAGALQLLGAEPVFSEATRAAEALAGVAADRPLFTRLAQRSPEFKAIQEAVAAGRALDELALAPLRVAI